mgnify:CR=1 FL=1
MKMKKWLTLGVCVTTLSMLTGIYPTFQSVHAANDTQSTSTTNTLNETSTTTSTTSVTKSEETTSTVPNTANTTSEVAVQAAVQSVKPIEGTIKNVNQENGTYDVVVKVNAEIKSGIKEVKVPIWQKTDQSDLKWYQAEKQNDGTWLVHMNIANHQYHRGLYTTHVYVYANDGSYEAVNLGETGIKNVATQLSANITNVDTVNGSFDVVVRGVSGSGIHHVKVPIWSTPNQSDLKWYDAVKQSDGSYIAHMDIRNHNYRLGKYTIHVYMYNNDHTGLAKNIGQVDIKGVADTLEANVLNVNVDSGSYDVVVKASTRSGIRKVQVPIWSAKDQNDLKWYDAVKQADGTYVVHMNIKNHKYHRGEYTTHVYITANDGHQYAKNIGTTQLPDINNQLKAEVANVNDEKGTFDVIVHGKIDSGIKKIQVPIWSTPNQSDLKWYDAVKQSDGSYIAHIDIKNHKYHRGEYTAHVYMTANSGKQMAINIGKTKLSDKYNNVAAFVSNINEEQGSYDVVVNGHIDSGIKKIQVPIWSKKDQSDLKWYDAFRQNDGSYIVHMNIKNHKYHRGMYTTHVYMTANSGRQIATNIGTTNIPDVFTELKGEIKNINSDYGTYDVVVHGKIDSGIKSIRVPIWSKKDQSDLNWYNAVKQNDGSYVVHMDIQNHLYNTGIYNTHVYMESNNGVKKAIALPQTKVSANKRQITNSSISITNIDVEQGSYDVLVKVDDSSKVSMIKVPTWSTSNQSDIIWHKAEYIGNNTYKAHISVMDHQLLSGKYTSHVYVYLKDNPNNPIAVSAGTVDLYKPYKIIDISEHQKPSLIDYDKLSKNVRGVIIRVQYGQKYVDHSYITHISEFKKRGVPVAVYAWVRGKDMSQMISEATYFYNRVAKYNPAFWWLDVEEPGLMSNDYRSVRDGIEVYRQTLKQLGAGKVGLYIANHMFSNYNIDITKFDGVWIPTYGVNNGRYEGYNPTSTNNYDLHQYTSDGRLPGYDYGLDISRLIRRDFNYFFNEG